jgi:hypothetical protein
MSTGRSPFAVLDVRHASVGLQHVTSTTLADFSPKGPPIDGKAAQTRLDDLFQSFDFLESLQGIAKQS